MSDSPTPYRPTDPADPTTWKPGRSFWRVVDRPGGRSAKFADDRFDCTLAAADGRPPPRPANWLGFSAAELPHPRRLVRRPAG